MKMEILILNVKVNELNIKLYIIDMDSNLFLEENQRRKEMKHYSLMHKLESHSNLNNNDNNDNNNNNEELAEFINNFYDKMGTEELKSIVSKCISDKTVRHLILKFELEQYNQKTAVEPISLKQFEKEASKILNRYTHKAGGFLLEDREWTVQLIDTSCTLFKNSLDKFDVDDVDTKEFMSKIVYRLNSLSDNIYVTLKYVPSKGDSLTFVCLIAKDMSVKNSKKIDL